MSSTTVVVSVGRNIGTTPMADRQWTAFRSSVRSALTDALALVFVDGAYSRGEWDGVAETSATWVASVEPIEVPYLERAFAALAKDFSQDAIALTIGHTFLIGEES